MPLAAEEPIELEARRSERYLPCTSLVFFHFFKPITSPAFRPRPTVINLPPLLPLPPPPPKSHTLIQPHPNPNLPYPHHQPPPLPGNLPQRLLLQRQRRLQVRINLPDLRHTFRHRL